MTQPIAAGLLCSINQTPLWEAVAAGVDLLDLQALSQTRRDLRWLAASQKCLAASSRWSRTLPRCFEHCLPRQLTGSRRLQSLRKSHLLRRYCRRSLPVGHYLRRAGLSLDTRLPQLALLHRAMQQRSPAQEACNHSLFTNLQTRGTMVSQPKTFLAPRGVAVV